SSIHPAADAAGSPLESLARFRARRRGPLPFADVAGASALVVLGSERLQLDHAPRDRAGEDLFQERDTPAAAGPGAAALRQLTGDLRSVQANEILQLATRDAKAKTDVVVQVHTVTAAVRCQRPRPSWWPSRRCPF